MRKYFVIAALLVPLLTTALYPKLGDGMLKHRRELYKELNLTDSQKSQVDKLHSEHQLKAIDLRAEIDKLRLQIKDEMDEKNIDESKVLSLTKKVSDLQAQLKASAVSMRVKTYNLLDDKQKEIWKEKRFDDNMGRGDGLREKHSRMKKMMEHRDCVN